jgi:hypothetical protein
MTVSKLASSTRAPLAEASAFSISATGLLVLLLGIGATLSVFLFYLIQNEVDGIFVNELGQPVVRDINRAQDRIEYDKHLVGALAGMLAININLTKDDVAKFVSSVDLADGAIEHVYLAAVKDGAVNFQGEILDHSSPQAAPFSPVGLTDLGDLIRHANSTLQASSAILADRDHDEKKWLVLARPVRNSAGQDSSVLVGFSPLQDIFSELIARYKAGGLIQLTVGVNERDTFRLVLSLQRPGTFLDRMIAPPRMFERLNVDNTIWVINFTSALDGQPLLIATLPFIGMVAGLLLTLMLVAYVQAWHARNRKASAMAASLQRTNQELNRKFADEKRMAKALRKSEQRYRYECTMYDITERRRPKWR